MKKTTEQNKEPKQKTKYFTPRMTSWEKIRQLRAFDKTFYVTYTQRTCKIKVHKDNEVYLFGAGGDYSLSEFQMQQKLKRHILKLFEDEKIDIPHYTEKDISYSVYSKRILELPLDTELQNVQEFDVNKAYYQCAYYLGYITKEMYERYISLPKHIRLRFIGTIATRKRRYTYRRGKLGKNVEIIDNPTLRYAWFHICKVVDEAMKYFMELAGEENFLMYYVDGIYVSGNLKCDDILKKVEQRYNLLFKTTVVDGVWLKYNTQAKAHQIIIRKYDEDKMCYKDKPFTIKTPKKYEDDEFGKIISENT